MPDLLGPFFCPGVFSPNNLTEKVVLTQWGGLLRPRKLDIIQGTDVRPCATCVGIYIQVVPIQLGFKVATFGGSSRSLGLGEARLR